MSDQEGAANSRASSPDEESGPAESQQEPGPDTRERLKRAFGSKKVLVLAAISLVLLGAIFGMIATKSNFFTPVTGRVYSSEDLDSARSKARSDGYKSGETSGYADGQKAGYAEGKRAGCRQVFTALGAFSVMDYLDHLIGYRYPITYSSSSC